MKVRRIFDYLHPYLFGLYPVLFLAAYNKKQLEISYITPYILIIIAAVTVLLVILRFLFKNRRKAAVFLSLFIGVFFSYGHIRFLTKDVRISEAIGPDHLLVPLAFFIIIWGFIYIKRTRRKLEKITQFLNIVSVFLVAYSIGDIGLYKSRNPYRASKTGMATFDTASQTSSVDNYPDIYYIVPDRYSSEQTLRDIYQYDNSEFIKFLRSKGFYVVDNARSNYHKTAMSLASSLNMRHLLYLEDELGKKYEDWYPLYDMIENSEVVRYLKSKGYLYIHMGTWWKPTSKNPYADIDYSITSLSEFGSLFFGTTLLYPLCDKMGISSVFTDPWKIHYQRVLFKFEQLAKIPSLKSPKFVFVHFNFPHPPYLFDKDGNYVPLKEARGRDRYTDQLTFANKKFIELIGSLIKASPTPPIIIIQSDEGPFPVRYAADELKFKWKEAAEEELNEKFGILNAIYLPGNEEHQWYPSVTPVNTFRIIFNRYFNENFELLPDKSFAVSSDEHPYDFIDVTNILVK